MAKVSITAAARIAIGTVGTVLAANSLSVFVTIIALAGAIVAGVVLPAVWSAKPGRRAAALAVLQEILRTTRRFEPSPPVSQEKRSSMTSAPSERAASH